MLAASYRQNPPILHHAQLGGVIWRVFCSIHGESFKARLATLQTMLFSFVVAVCGGVDADVYSVFALLPLYGVRLVIDTNHALHMAHP